MYEYTAYVTFKNVSQDTLTIPADMIRGGKGWVGSDTLTVKPGDTFDVAMGYAAPKSAGRSRRPSTIERATAKQIDERGNKDYRRVVPADKAVRAAWEKCPPWKHYDVRLHGNPYEGIREATPAPAPVEVSSDASSGKRSKRAT